MKTRLLLIALGLLMTTNFLNAQSISSFYPPSGTIETSVTVLGEGFQ